MVTSLTLIGVCIKSNLPVWRFKSEKRNEIQSSCKHEGNCELMPYDKLSLKQKLDALEKEK